MENLGETVKRIKWRADIFLSITSVSHNITSGTQTGEFKSSEKAWYWNIKKLQGGSEISASVKVNTLIWTKLSTRQHYARGIWKRRFHCRMASSVFRPQYAGRRRLITQETPVFLDFWLSKTLVEKFHDYCDAIIFNNRTNDSYCLSCVSLVKES